MRAAFPSLVVALAAAPMMGVACPTGPVSTCEAMLRAQCEFSFRCCDAEERLEGPSFIGVGTSNYVSTEAECVDRAVGLCKTFAGGTEDSVRLGRMSFQGDAASACLTALNAARDQCDASLALDARRAGQPCALALGVGAVEPGATCASSSECRLGGTCIVDAEDPELNEEEGAVEGECAELADEGDDCGDLACGSGLVCDDGECAALPGDGDDCFAGSACGPGLYCDDGECAVPQVAGESCDSGFECLSGECDDGECAGDGVCDGN